MAKTKKKKKTSSAVLKALKGKSKQFRKARKAKPGQFTLPDIEDGTYVARVGTTLNSTKDDVPIVNFKWTVARGPEKGKSHRVSIFLENEDADREQAAFDDLSRRLQVLGVDVDELDATDLPDILAEIDEDKPLVRIGLKNGESQNGTPYLNCYFNELLEDEEDEDDEEDETEEDEEEEDSDEEAEDEEEEDEEDEEVDEDEDDEEEEYDIIEKGDSVKYKRKTYEVSSSNKGKETCSLKHKSGSTVKNVSWDDVVLLD